MDTIPHSINGFTAIDVATKAIREAGDILKKHFTKSKSFEYKGKKNLVTEIDLLSEKHIVNSLKTEYPDWAVLSEESFSSISVNGYTWVIDPIDGTNNYLFGVPHFCVNIALVKNQEILIGLTYDPIKDELFFCEKGKGAYLNNTLINVTNVTSLNNALIGVDLGYNLEMSKILLQLVNKLWENIHCVRLMGSAALGLAYVASGRMSLYFHGSLYPWDTASGILLVKEAGGIVIDWDGKPVTIFSEKIIASNRELSIQLQKTLSDSAI